MASASLTYDQFDSAVRKGRLAPLYFFYGDEPYLADLAQRLLIETAVAPHERDFNFDIFYGAETEARQVLAACASFPMMAERRLVIVRDFEALPENGLFMAYAERPNPTAVVVLVCRTKPRLNTNPYAALKKKAVAVELKEVKDAQLGRWINKLVVAEGKAIDDRAAHMLAQYAGPSLQQIATEVQKLLSYIGDRPSIEEDDILVAIGQTREHNVFELQKAVGRQNYPEAMTIAERLLQQASNPAGEAIRIIAILTAFYIKVWKIDTCRTEKMSDRGLAGYIGVPPYFVKEYIASTRRMGSRAISDGFRTLLTADYELKGGSSRDPRLILNLALGRLVQARAAV